MPAQLACVRRLPFNYYPSLCSLYPRTDDAVHYLLCSDLLVVFPWPSILRFSSLAKHPACIPPLCSKTVFVSRSALTGLHGSPALALPDHCHCLHTATSTASPKSVHARFVFGPHPPDTFLHCSGLNGNFAHLPVTTTARTATAPLRSNTDSSLSALVTQPSSGSALLWPQRQFRKLWQLPITATALCTTTLAHALLIPPHPASGKISL